MKRLATIGMLCVLFLNMGFVSHAHEFKTKKIEDAELMQRIVESSRLQRIASPKFTGSIKSFDVNEKGMLAVLYGSYIIHVYDAKGTFLYGYTFWDSGDYGMEWADDENIWLYSVRSKTAQLISPQAKHIEIRNIIPTPSEHYRQKWKELRSTEQTIGGTNFRLSICRIYREEAKGEDVCIYQSCFSYWVISIIKAILIGGFVIMLIGGIYRQYKGNTKRT